MEYHRKNTTWNSHAHDVIEARLCEERDMVCRLRKEADDIRCRLHDIRMEEKARKARIERLEARLAAHSSRHGHDENTSQGGLTLEDMLADATDENGNPYAVG